MRILRRRTSPLSGIGKIKDLKKRNRIFRGYFPLKASQIKEKAELDREDLFKASRGYSDHNISNILSDSKRFSQFRNSPLTNTIYARTLAAKRLMKLRPGIVSTREKIKKMDQRIKEQNEATAILKSQIAEVNRAWKELTAVVSHSPHDPNRELRRDIKSLVKARSVLDGRFDEAVHSGQSLVMDRLRLKEKKTKQLYHARKRA
jgi:predicted  nucleic acid-binding Zn-ribbon protein